MSEAPRAFGASALRRLGARLRDTGKRRGPPLVRSMIWNWEFRSGQWRYLEHSPDALLYEVVARFLDGGHLLDLGCGNGSTRCEMPDGSFARYVGVDISRGATRRTAERAANLPEPRSGQLLIVGDISDPRVLSATGGPFDVVLLRESIYYLGEQRVPELLDRLRSTLSHRGVIVVKIHDRTRYSTYVEHVRRHLSIVEEHAGAGELDILLVGR